MDSWLDDDLMMKITIENNLSETAFAVEENDKYKLKPVEITNEIVNAIGLTCFICLLLAKMLTVYHLVLFQS